jgi:hypothetical protein
MPGIVYDTGALLAVERGNRAVARLHLQAVASGVRPVVPANVLAQAWRGGPQASLSLLLKGCLVTAMDDRLARAVGAACGKAGTRDVVDASVVVTAAALGAVVVTSDPDDLEHLADAIAVPLTLRTV